MMETLAEGFKVVYELKSDPKYRLIPIVIVSAIGEYIGLNVDKNFLQVNEFIKKPIIPSEFLKKH